MFCETMKFSQPNVTALKKAILKQYPTFRSSHVDEALAWSFGFRTYASMLAMLRQISGATRLLVQMDAALLQLRLEQLGYSGLDLPLLRRAFTDTQFPDAWVGDELEQSLIRRRLPAAANSDRK